MSTRPVLFSYFERAASVMLAQYEQSKEQRASKNLGDNRETFCREFLEKVLPPKLSVKRGGEIWDSSNHQTGQMDIAVLRDDAPSLHVGEADVHLADGVFAVIEVKSNLTTAKLDEAAVSFQRVAGLDAQGGTIIQPADLPALRRPLRIVFAYDGCTWETIHDKIVKKGWNELFDLICVLKRGAFFRNGGLLKCEAGGEFVSVPGKAAALGFLYFWLTSYCSTFIARTFDIKPYFEPYNDWAE